MPPRGGVSAVLPAALPHVDRISQFRAFWPGPEDSYLRFQSLVRLLQKSSVHTLRRLPHNARVVLCGGLGGHRVDQGEQRRRDWPRSGLARLEVMLQGLGPRRTVSLRPSGTGRAGRGSNAGGARLSGIVTENSAVGPSGRRAPPPPHFLHGRHDSLPMARPAKTGAWQRRSLAFPLHSQFCCKQCIYCTATKTAKGSRP